MGLRGPAWMGRLLHGGMKPSRRCAIHYFPEEGPPTKLLYSVLRYSKQRQVGIEAMITELSAVVNGGTRSKWYMLMNLVIRRKRQKIDY